FIIQVLPDAEEILIDRLENRIKSLPAITSIIEEGLDGEEMLNKILEGFEFEILEKNEIRYNCDCSEERLEKALISVGRNELKEIIQKDGEAELTCHFCNTVYKFHKEHLEKLYSAAQ
ncbi:MAG: Hsp33 family molecular chaperone HslO, partial [Alkaliphilus sp.]|nr:Hsp33 family molecular chaperone HslO [Alkaliphilus sp.]